MDRRNFLKCSLALAGGATIPLALAEQSSLPLSSHAATESILGNMCVRTSLGDVLFVVPNYPTFSDESTCWNFGRMRFDTEKRCEVLSVRLLFSDEFRDLFKKNEFVFDVRAVLPITLSAGDSCTVEFPTPSLAIY